MRSWNALVLPEPPISGLYAELSFAPPRAHPLTWVEFEDGEDIWVGKFALGERRNGPRPSVQRLRGNAFFILSAGNGYLLDADTRTILKRVEDGLSPVISHLLVPARGEVVTADYLGLTVLGLDGTSWTTGRFSYDGIRLDADGSRDVVTGRYWSPIATDEVEWPMFWLHLEPRTLEFERPDLIAEPWYERLTRRLSAN